MFVAIPVIVQIEFVEFFACGQGDLTSAMLSGVGLYFLTNQLGLWRLRCRVGLSQEGWLRENRKVRLRAKRRQGWLGFSPRKANNIRFPPGSFTALREDSTVTKTELICAKTFGLSQVNTQRSSFGSSL